MLSSLAILFHVIAQLQKAHYANIPFITDNLNQMSEAFSKSRKRSSPGRPLLSMYFMTLSRVHLWEDCFNSVYCGLYCSFIINKVTGCQFLIKLASASFVGTSLKLPCFCDIASLPVS